MVYQIRKMHLSACFIAVLLSTVWADTIKVTGREGMSVTLKTQETGLQKENQIVWMFGPDKPSVRIASLNGGEVTTDYAEGFRDRLQLDRQTGSLTITDLNISDCGTYLVQIITAKISSHHFHLTVYRLVSTPYINISASLVSARCTSVSVECSVQNGREVILGWYRGEERLNQTSSPDPSVKLSLPLEIKDHDGDIYRCVAKNPVDEKAAKLPTAKTCQRSGESTWCSQTQATVRLVVSAVVGVALIVAVIDHFRLRRRSKKGR